MELTLSRQDASTTQVSVTCDRKVSHSFRETVCKVGGRPLNKGTAHKMIGTQSSPS